MTPLQVGLRVAALLVIRTPGSQDINLDHFAINLCSYFGA
jgi:hypothetical protein